MPSYTAAESFFKQGCEDDFSILKTLQESTLSALSNENLTKLQIQQSLAADYWAKVDEVCVLVV